MTRPNDSQQKEKEKNRPSSGLYHPGRPQSKIERKQKEGPCLKTAENHWTWKWWF